jgi:hypothetical protein
MKKFQVGDVVILVDARHGNESGPYIDGLNHRNHTNYASMLGKKFRIKTTTFSAYDVECLEKKTKKKYIRYPDAAFPWRFRPATPDDPFEKNGVE